VVVARSQLFSVVEPAACTALLYYNTRHGTGCHAGFLRKARRHVAFKKSRASGRPRGSTSPS
jgi:hypothetical protein